MLPGFRFIFAATILSLSLVIFGLGAAGLLRSTHGKYIGQSIRRAELAYYPPQQTFPNPTAAMLRLDDVVLTPPEETTTTSASAHVAAPAETVPLAEVASVATIASSPRARDEIIAEDKPVLGAIPASQSSADATAPRPANLTVANVTPDTPQPAPEPVAAPQATEPAGAEPAPVVAATETAPAPAASSAIEPSAAEASVAGAPAVAPIEISEPAIAIADVILPRSRPTFEPAHHDAPEQTVVAAAISDTEPTDKPLKAAEVHLPMPRPASAPATVAATKTDDVHSTAAANDSAPVTQPAQAAAAAQPTNEPASTAATAADAQPATSTVASNAGTPDAPKLESTEQLHQQAISEADDIALSAAEVRLPISRPKVHATAKTHAKSRSRVAERQAPPAAPPAPATYRASTISFGGLLR